MNSDIVLMGHGGGGSLTASLINDIFIAELGNPILLALDDAASLDIPQSQLVMSTDTYVIQPLFFPGGDIGKLAACGTINDVAMQGGKPLYMSLGLIIEEGLPIDDLRTIIQSLSKVLEETNVQIVTGDTKVIDRRKDALHSNATGGIFINTTAIGVSIPTLQASASNAQPSDKVIVTGTLGDHGITIANLRDSLGLESTLQSDAAPLSAMIEQIADAGHTTHCLRDPTRGGLAAALCDIAEKSRCSIQIQESSLPVKDSVAGACDLLGFDILNVPNEGKAVIICPDQQTDNILGTLRSHPYGRDATVIGEVAPDDPGSVILHTRAGGQRIVDVPAGEDLPRIC